MARRGRPFGSRRPFSLFLELLFERAHAYRLTAFVEVGVDEAIAAEAHGLGVEVEEIATVDVFRKVLIAPFLEGLQILLADMGHLGHIGEFHAAAQTCLAKDFAEALRPTRLAGLIWGLGDIAHGRLLRCGAGCRALAIAAASAAFSSSSRRFTATLRPSDRAASHFRR